MHQLRTLVFPVEVLVIRISLPKFRDGIWSVKFVETRFISSFVSI